MRAAIFAMGTPVAFGDERHRAAGAGIDFENVNILVFDRELHIHQADDTDFAWPATPIVVRFHLTMAGGSECGGREQELSPE